MCRMRRTFHCGVVGHPSPGLPTSKCWLNKFQGSAFTAPAILIQWLHPVCGDFHQPYWLYWYHLIYKDPITTVSTLQHSKPAYWPPTQAFISTIVQLYLGWRIRILSRSNLLASLVFFLAFVSFVAGVTSTIFTAVMPSFGQIHKYQSTVMLWLAASAACDVVISVSLVWFLVSVFLFSLLSFIMVWL